MEERRQYPRLAAQVFWRSASLHAPQRRTVDISLGGMLVYSDEPVSVGARLILEVGGAGGSWIDVHARVVRVDELPAGTPARYDVAFEFLDVPDHARASLAALLGVAIPAGRHPTNGVGSLQAPADRGRGSSP